MFYNLRRRNEAKYIKELEIIWRYKMFSFSVGVDLDVDYKRIYV